MAMRYSGGCACGAIRYETDAAPIASNHCQCRDCQRRSGAGHSSYLVFADRAELRLAGVAREWRVAGDSGSEKVHAFCPNCGTPVWLGLDAAPRLIAVHAGSLDDPGLFSPQAVTYHAVGAAWDMIDPGLPVFDRMPPA